MTGPAPRSLGLAVTVVVNLALAALNLYQRRQIEQQQRQGGCASMALPVTDSPCDRNRRAATLYACTSWLGLCLLGISTAARMRAAVGRGSCVGVAAHA